MRGELFFAGGTTSSGEGAGAVFVGFVSAGVVAGSDGCVPGCLSDADGTITTGDGAGALRLRQPAPLNSSAAVAIASKIVESLRLGMCIFPCAGRHAVRARRRQFDGE